jgi:hypothetical protein
MLGRMWSEIRDRSANMIDRIYVEKAADAGFGKISLLQDDPWRYTLRAIGAGMGLTLVVFVFWVLKQNLRDISAGAVIASGFFGVGLMIIVFTNTELFTSNNMYLPPKGARAGNKPRCFGFHATLEISLARFSFHYCLSALAH